VARHLPLICLAALVALALPAVARADSATAGEIVVLRAGGLTRGELLEAGVSADRRLPIPGVQVVTAAAGRAGALAALRADPDVRWAEPNRPRDSATADPLGGLLWGLQNTGQAVWWHHGTPDADIDAPEAWASTRGAGVTVAVVDSGVDLGHPDLAGRLTAGHDFVDDDSIPADLNGHGTHVAGTIAAGENGVGAIGVAPAALVMPLRVLDAGGSGNSADVAAAFAYAGDHGARVVNASLGSEYPSLAEREAIRAHPGTLFVVAAGNGGADGVGDDNDGGTAEYPCAYDEPNLVCVGSSDSDDARSVFSNFGAVSVDLFAPGENIVSAYIRGRTTYLDHYFGTGDGYELMLGTSMAAPHVAGAAALALAARPSAATAQVKAALLDGADRLPDLAGRAVSGGRLNAAAAVALASGTPRVPAIDAPALGPAPASPGGPAAPESAPGTAPVIGGLRLRGRPRVCRAGCRARAATLSFVLTAAADVTAQLERRRCGRTRCRWPASGSRMRRASAGRTRWTIGARLLGMPLARGRWRVTLATPGGRAALEFKVR
jgi:thermitase